VIESDEHGAVSCRPQVEENVKKPKSAECDPPPEGLAFVYALLDDPGEGEEFRMFYVGSTAGSLRGRMAAHRGGAAQRKGRLVYQYIRRMNLGGRQFGVRVLEVCMAGSRREREIYWMNGLAAIGEPIQNEDGIVLPESGEFAALAAAIRAHPELKPVARRLFARVMFLPFDFVWGSLYTLMEKKS